MTTITTDQGLIIPANADLNDIPTSFGSFSGANPSTGLSGTSGVESRLVKRYLSATDRAARNPTPATGEMSFRADAGVFEYYNGSAWTGIFAGTTLPQGFQISKSDTTSNVAVTTTETVSTYVQWPATIGRRYEIWYRGAYESSIAGDIVVVKLRNAASTVDVTGAIIATAKGGCDFTSRGQPFMLFGQLSAPSTATMTVVATIIRDTGTGTVRQNGNTGGMELYFIVNDVGV